jgi:hypothetical protein
MSTTSLAEVMPLVEKLSPEEKLRSANKGAGGDVRREQSANIS